MGTDDIICVYSCQDAFSRRCRGPGELAGGGNFIFFYQVFFSCTHSYWTVSVERCECEAEAKRSQPSRPLSPWASVSFCLCPLDFSWGLSRAPRIKGPIKWQRLMINFYTPWLPSVIYIHIHLYVRVCTLKELQRKDLPDHWYTLLG